MRKITIEMEVPAADFVSSLLGSSFSTWTWWCEVTYDEGYNWKTYPEDFDLPYLTLGIEDPNGEEDEEGNIPTVTKKVSVNDLVKAYAATAQSYRMNWEDHDAASGDAVMQYAVLGEVAYA